MLTGSFDNAGQKSGWTSRSGYTFFDIAGPWWSYRRTKRMINIAGSVIQQVYTGKYTAALIYAYVDIRIMHALDLTSKRRKQSVENLASKLKVFCCTFNYFVLRPSTRCKKTRIYLRERGICKSANMSLQNYRTLIANAISAWSYSFTAQSPQNASKLHGGTYLCDFSCTSMAYLPPRTTRNDFIFLLLLCYGSEAKRSQRSFISLW